MCVHSRLILYKKNFYGNMPRYKRSVSFPDEDAINEGLGNLQQRGIHTSQAGLGKLKTVVCKILKG